MLFNTTTGGESDVELRQSFFVAECSSDVTSPSVDCLFPELQVVTDALSIKKKALAVASYKRSSFFV